MSHFPRSSTTVAFPNGTTKCMDQPCTSILHLYRYLQGIYPALEKGGFRLDLVIEGNTTAFRVIFGASVLQWHVLLGEMDSEYIHFEIELQWDTIKWPLHLVIDASDLENTMRWYGEWDPATKTAINWYKSIKDALFWYDEATAAAILADIQLLLCIHKGYIKCYLYLSKMVHEKKLNMPPQCKEDLRLQTQPQPHISCLPPPATKTV